MEELIPKLLEHGLGVAILAYAWWRAEDRAAAAQKLADQRADTMAQMMTDQVATNEKVTTAMALQNQILERIDVWMGSHLAGGL